MEIYFYTLVLIFISINIKIIYADICYKKIPNTLLKYLVCILPFWYIYLWSANISDVGHIWILLIQILVTLLVSFGLYCLSIWSAGDAKYLLVLSLFIPYIGIITLIGNIAIITIIYLVGYFLYFYLGKSLLYTGYGKMLFTNIYQDLRDRIYHFIREEDMSIRRKQAILKIIKFIVVFLIIFTSLRLLRVYLLKYLYSGNSIAEEKQDLLFQFLETYHIYILIISGVIFIGIFALGKHLYMGFKKKIIGKYKHFFAKKYGISIENIDAIIISIVCIILLLFITWEFILHTEQIRKLLFLIFTVYIGLWICIKILWYSYKLAFQVSEQKNILIQKLHSGDIIDKHFLHKMFSSHKALHNIEYSGKGNIKNIFGEQTPREYFKNIHNPIEETTVKELQEIYMFVNKNTKKTEQIQEIQIIQSFPFAPYLLLGFIYTYFYGDTIFEYIVSIIIYIVQGIYI